ncbi:hypothetical protein [Edwardsiella piscicida]|uniref:hypothetical protein n=1 Tax=Edwardsiella piscicida TaxID=1263550 RepID=UPI001114C3D4|nr:hypothetical protein [Edwardsiella piscicida]
MSQTKNDALCSLLNSIDFSHSRVTFDAHHECESDHLFSPDEQEKLNLKDRLVAAETMITLITSCLDEEAKKRLSDKIITLSHNPAAINESEIARSKLISDYLERLSAL